MTDLIQLYLVRHTTPEVLPGVCYGQSDIPLADTFAQESAATLDKLHLYGLSTFGARATAGEVQVFSSPLRRCQQLAAAFCGLHNLPMHLDPRLMELHFGAWEMRPWQEIPAGLIASWEAQHVLQAPPGGESFQQLQTRCNNFMQEQLGHLLSPDSTTRTLVLFTHAGVIRALVAAALHLPLHQAYRLQIDFGSVSALHYKSDQMQLAFLNR